MTPPNFWQIAIIVLIIVLLFGATKLPKLAKSLGQSMRIFKSEVNPMREDDQRHSPETSEDAVEGRVLGSDSRTGRPASEASEGSAEHPQGKDRI